MKPAAVLSTEKGLGLASGVLFILGVAALSWNSDLDRALKTRVKEYRMDLALSQRKEEQENAYREILSRGGAPGARLEQNEWIQSAQALAREQGLDLREITPAADDAQGRGEVKLTMTLEGEIKDWVGFLRRLADSPDPVYVDAFKISPAGTQKNRLRMEMVLAQL